MALMFQMASRFHQLWDERSKAEPAPDLLSMMIHSDALSEMTAQEFMGNMALLIVGGNDTTRNSMSAIVTAFSQFPEEWERLMADERLIPNAANEIIRWQSPVAHMRRTVMEDTEFRGHRFRKGDKVVLWYVSGNRDEAVFEDGQRFDITRENARRHISFGYGVHRCVGARLAEMQIQVLLSEMRVRGMRPELAGDIVRGRNNFISSLVEVPVRLAP
jgi:cytochrome P450